MWVLVEVRSQVVEQEWTLLAALASPYLPWASASRREARSSQPTQDWKKWNYDLAFYISPCKCIKCKQNWQRNPWRLAFNSLIFSWRLEFDSFSFCVSLRSWFTIRTASTKIAALSVLGGLPGSKMEPSSRNLFWDSS